MSLPFVELELIPVRAAESEKGHHDFEQTGVQVQLRGKCIVSDCKRKSRTICIGCTRDTIGLVHVCEPKDGNQCWEKLHAARVRYPVDNNGNPAELPKLTKERETKQQSWI